jgi:hypothetical protein
MPFKTVHVDTLERAVDAVGSAQLLQEYLDVDRDSVAAWREGQVRMPADVFLRVIDLLFDAQIKGALPLPAVKGTNAVPSGPLLQFRIADNVAHCPACDHVDFVRVGNDAEVRNDTPLACSHCNRRIARGDLIVLLADDVAKRGGAMVVANRKRQQATRTSIEAFRQRQNDELVNASARGLLARAVKAYGTEQALAEHLQVSVEDVVRWAAGSRVPPTIVLDRVIEIVRKAGLEALKR